MLDIARSKPARINATGLRDTLTLTPAYDGAHNRVGEREPSCLTFLLVRRGEDGPPGTAHPVDDNA
ncbi:hypothetical protein MAGR_58680 [Mycolicibacterium agri]|uniref:Uncharacterized protein n=1 Tax=Mycolicibacterium agri TaxID=36811 RepID=A0A7I9WAW6_MYCAG|nr:hypothetical protein MAGR_58680 [Mycolicibacterium agri]